MDPFNPHEAGEPPRRILRYVGGFCAGAVLGAGLLLWFVAVIAPAFGGHYEALTPLIIAVVGSPIAALAGGILGVLWVRRISRPDGPPRAVRRGIGIAIVVAVLLWIVLPLLQTMVREDARFRQQTEVRRLVEHSFADEESRWNRKFASRYPRNGASLEPLLGPLLYPGAALVTWEDHEIPADMPWPPGWEITVSTADHPDDVLAYYTSVLPEGIEGYGFGNVPGPRGHWMSTSARQKSADGRSTIVRLEGKDETVTIRFVTMSDDMSYGEPVDKPWPDRDAYRKFVETERQPYIDAMHDEFGDWLYPGAKLNFGNVRTLENIAFETSDPMDDVVAFYAAHDLEPHWRDDRYSFSRRGAFVRIPLVLVYPIHGGTRIHFVHMR